MIGDIAKVYVEGFITITGRLSRFSKIGGEMVPHILIEEELQRLAGDGEEEDDEDGMGQVAIAVTAGPDAKKGERLIVLHTRDDLSLSDLCQGLTEAGLPNLWIPSQDSFLQVDEIPVLGTGKLDLQAIKQVARSHFG